MDVFVFCTDDDDNEGHVNKKCTKKISKET